MDQRFEWTEEADAQLVELQRQGFSYTEIAAKLGCSSRNAIGGRIMRLRDRREFGPKPKQAKPKTRAERERRQPGLAHVPLIKARLDEGKTDREIAREVGLRPDDIRYVRRIKGFSPGTRPAPPPPAYAADVARLAGEGRNDREISEQLDITIWQARLERLRQGIKPVNAQPKRESVTTIVKGDPGAKIAQVFAEGFMGQKSRVGLMEMPRLGLCRFPIDQPSGEIRYCGDSVEDGRVYCTHHAARCYVPAPPAKLRPSHVYTSRR